MTPPHWQCGPHAIVLDTRALVLGILNVTPDSFSDGRDAPAEAFIARGMELLADGADALDIGGESTRPGSHPVAADEQIRRVAPVIQALAQTGRLISVDTTRRAVAEIALKLGAAVVNDVSGLADDPALAELIAETGAGVIVMHRQGTPLTMQLAPRYDDVIGEVNEFFAERLRWLASRGVRPGQVALDPGIGFGKTLDHNLQLLARLDTFQAHGRPVCLGVSRKGFLGAVTGRGVADRLIGSVAVAARALARRSAQVLRVHDVAATRDAVLLDEAIRRHDAP